MYEPLIYIYKFTYAYAHLNSYNYYAEPTWLQTLQQYVFTDLQRLRVPADCHHFSFTTNRFMMIKRLNKYDLFEIVAKKKIHSSL